MRSTFAAAPVRSINRTTHAVGKDDTSDVIEEMQDEATDLLGAGEYSHALAEFSVLREIRSRREGPYSPMYLSNMHDCIRCMSHLAMWSDSSFLCRELHPKYVRTHGRGQADTVDVAKHWAWALVHLADWPPAVRLYLLTADALWDSDPEHARRLLGAALVHRHDADVAALVSPGLIDGVTLRHTADVTSALDQLAGQLRSLGDHVDETATINGVAFA